jgi:hypothetical protein
MSEFWIVRQWNQVVHRFRDSNECTAEIWDEISISIAVLMEKGPYQCGPKVTKRLNPKRDGIWELIATVGNHQARLLFYVEAKTVVFVDAFMKTGGNKDYDIPLAKKRRASIQQGRALSADIAGFVVH